jgi:cytochrome b561
LRPLHRWLHLTLIWGLFFVALTGFLLGLTSAVLLKAGGFLPIAPPMDWRYANAIIGQIHIIEFYALGAVAGGHAAFHIWRHVRLRDNALRIMVPKRLHRYL